jgi:hypothetical protein
MKRTLAVIITALSLAAAGATTAQANTGSHVNNRSKSTGIGAGKITFNPFSITRK